MSDDRMARILARKRERERKLKEKEEEFKKKQAAKEEARRREAERKFEVRRKGAEEELRSKTGTRGVLKKSRKEQQEENIKEKEQKNIDLDVSKKRWARVDGKWVFAQQNTTKSSNDMTAIREPHKHIDEKTLVTKTASTRWRKSSYGWSGRATRVITDSHINDDATFYNTQTTELHIPRDRYEQLGISSALNRESDFCIAASLLCILTSQYYCTAGDSMQYAFFIDLERAQNNLGNDDIDTIDHYEAALSALRAGISAIESTLYGNENEKEERDGDGEQIGIKKEEEEEKEDEEREEEEEDSSFNNWMYWRTHLPSIDMDEYEQNERKYIMDEEEQKQQEINEHQEKDEENKSIVITDTIIDVDVVQIPLTLSNTTESYSPLQRKQLTRLQGLQKWYNKHLATLEKMQSHSRALLLDPESQALFTHLPPELFMQVFNYLSHGDLANVCSVCHMWNIVANDDYLYRELLRTGYPTSWESALILKKYTSSSWKTIYRNTVLSRKTESYGICQCNKCDSIYWRIWGSCMACGSSLSQSHGFSLSHVIERLVTKKRPT